MYIGKIWITKISKAPLFNFFLLLLFFSSETSNKQILQQVTSDFLQRATSVTSNERILKQITSHFLQRVTSGFLQ